MIEEIPLATHRTEHIKAAIRAVPRHPFIPVRAQALLGADETEQIIDRDADPKAWWAAVYSDSVIVTQIADGTGEIRAGAREPTSSASAPSTVADLLGWLEPEPGHRVLEVGTGTGWTAALLSHLVGDEGVATSIEVDPQVAERAAKNLSDAGVQAQLVVGDGAAGCPGRAPFDRVHVTCGIRQVPHNWIEQTRPGGTIVLPYCPGLGNGHGLRLTVFPDGTASGRFQGFAAYMMMRSQRPAHATRDDGSGQYSSTRIDPRTIAYAPPGALVAMAGLTGFQVTSRQQGDQFYVWVVDQDHPEVWTLVTHEPGQPEFEVYQLGERSLWEEVTDAYFRWVGWGEPSRERFGMTVTPEWQRILLDSPDHHLS